MGDSAVWEVVMYGSLFPFYNLQMIKRCIGGCDVWGSLYYGVATTSRLLKIISLLCRI